MMDKITVIMLVGPPCSGKTTWITDNKNKIFNRFNESPIVVVSKETVRERISDNSSYQYTKEKEDIVITEYYDRLRKALTIRNAVIILDDLNIYKKDIEKHLLIFKPLMKAGKLDFHIKTFDTPINLLSIRNSYKRMRLLKHYSQENLEALYNSFKSLDLFLYQDYMYD